MDGVRILGVRVNAVTMSDALQRVEGFILRGGPHLVVTANSEMVMRANEDPLLAQILERADLVIPDGIGVVWASKITGTPLPQRVPGIELMEQILRASVPKKWRIFLLGAECGVAEKAAEKIREVYPGISIVGTHHGFFSRDEEPQVLDLILASKPDILFVALGVPRQEKWTAARLSKLKIPLGIGVGGSLNVWAGTDKRAPQWMCRTGLEWLYRLIRQPWRCRRMAVLPQFVLWVLLERFIQRGNVTR